MFHSDRLLVQYLKEPVSRLANSSFSLLFGDDHDDPATRNTFAWLLSTGPTLLRDLGATVELAQGVMNNESNTQEQKSTCINTLGVALYRAGKPREALEVLEESVAMQTADSQPFDLYFLSMCSSRLNEPDQAREYFVV